MKKKIAEIKSLSLAVAQHFRQQDMAFITPLLHPEAVWVRSQDSHVFCGSRDVAKALQSIRLPFTASYGPISCHAAYALPGSSNVCIVLCDCGTHGECCQCVTFLWEAGPEGPKLLHIHASMREPSAIKLNGLHKERYYLHPSQIKYVEADNIYCYVVYDSREYHINHPLALMEELLPDYFLRIHRSFLVNLHAIESLHDHHIELTGGIELPVPERRYRWLEEYLYRWK